MDPAMAELLGNRSRRTSEEPRATGGPKPPARDGALPPQANQDVFGAVSLGSDIDSDCSSASVMTEDRKSVAVDSVADMLDTQEIKDDISVLSLATKRDKAAQEDADGAALSPQNPTIRTSDSTASRASLDSSGNRKKNNRKSKSGRKSWRKSRFGDPPEPELPELTRRQQLVDDLQDTYDPAEADGAVAVAERMFGPANFGTIQFDNLNIAWYVRVRASERNGIVGAPEDMMTFMTKTLRYPLPRLLISVTGGAADFNLPKEIEDRLKLGLRKAVDSTDAWIVTGGTDCGIMKYVGRAIAEVDLATGTKSQPRPVIGIATYGVLKARRELESGGRHDGLEAARVPASKINVGLDANHNVFFLYDDGSEGKFGREVELRSIFEQEITETPFETYNSALPVFQSLKRIFSVVLVVEGGPGTLSTVKHAIKARTPVLILEGSGRCADVLAYAWRFLHDASPSARHFTLSGLRQRIKKMGGKSDSKSLLITQTEVLDVVQASGQVTICGALDEHGTSSRSTLDETMLETMLNSQRLEIPEDNKFRAMAKYSMHQRALYLSMVFRRADKAEISLSRLQNLKRNLSGLSDPRLGGKSQFEVVTQVLQDDLRGALRWSLLSGNDAFIKMLCLPTRLDDLYSFLHENKNENLNLIFSVDKHLNPKKHVIQQLVACMRGSADSEIRKVGRSASLIPNPSADVLRLEDNGSLSVANSLVSRSLLTSVGLRHRVTHFLGAEYDAEKGKLVSSAPANRLRRNHAYLDLMIWAIMFDQSHDVVEYFWQHGGNSTSTALFAAILLRAMASTKALMKEQFKRAREEMNASSEEFEKWSCGVLEECHNNDSVLTQLILKTNLFHLRGFAQTAAATNCTALALYGQRSKFLSHSALLAKVDIDWFGDIDPQTNMGFIVANAIFPPLLLQGFVLPVRFTTEGPGNKHGKKGRARRKAALSSKSSVALRGRKGASVAPAPVDKPSLLNRITGDTGTRAQSKLGQIAKFYGAPVVKFVFGIISHAVLLTLYTISILGDFTQPLSWLEYVLMFWFLALTTAELNDVLDDGLRAWSSHYWNLTELAGIVGFWTGMALRWEGRESRSYADVDRTTLESAKLMFALGISCNLVQIFRFYAGIPSLGPKLIMLAEMGPDVGVYLALFVVFMLNSGVFTETVLGQHRTGQQRNEVYDDENFHLGIDTLRRVAYRPWFQQFGELSLDDINADSDCTGTESFQDCSGYHALLPIAAGLYFLVVNVVLVNLLIAMMARTYEIVQENSMEHWHLQMHEVLREYDGRSAVPVPLSLPHTLYRSIAHIASILRDLLTCACRGSSGSEGEDDKTVMELDAVNSRMVESFQEKHTDRYLDKKDRDEEESRSVEISIQDLKDGQHHSMVTLNAKMVRLEATMDRIVTEQANGIHRSLASMQSAQTSMHQGMIQMSRFDSAALKKKVARMSMDNAEADAIAALHSSQTLEQSLEELEKTKMSWGKAKDEAMLLLPKKYELAADRSMGVFHSKKYSFKWFKPEGTNHQVGYCYQDPDKPGFALHDPSNVLVIYKCEEALASINTLKELMEPRMPDGSLVKRQMIIPSARPWTREFPEYTPLDYTSPHVHYFSKGSPVDVYKWGQSARPEIVRRHGDRSKCRQDEDGRPLNPYGRTGVRGRGVLGKWGINVAVHWIITKPLIDKDDMAMERSGMRMSTVLLERHVDGDWTIPGRMQDNDAIDPTLCTAFGLDGRTLQDSEELQTTEQILLDSLPNRTLSEAVGSDERDTDNAWVTFKIRLVDLGGSATVRNDGMKDGGLGRFEISDDLRSQSRLEWVVMHRHIHMQHASHYRIIEQLAKSQNTYW